jgi:rhamnosyl/mannosyltransferase
MRILHIYKDYFPVLGGIENHLRLLAEGLAERGHDVTVLVTNQHQQSQVAHPAPRLTVHKAARLFHTASTPLSIAMLNLARQQRADLVHLQFPYPPGDLAALAVPGAPPLVVSYQSDIVRQRTLLRLYRPLLELTLRRAAALLVASPAYIASSPFLQRFAAKCRIVPLGIQAERFVHTPQTVRLPGQFRLLFVGRLRYYKGLHVLLDAMPQIAATLLIAGTGPERERLAAQATALGIADRVQWLGDVADADLPALYRSADLFVLPSHLRAEAYGIVLAEALASGVPCISTDLNTGTSFVNQHDVTGLVVPPGDPNALATAINQLLLDPERRQRYATAAATRAQTLLTVDAMLDRVEAVYRDVLTQRQPRG